MKRDIIFLLLALAVLFTLRFYHAGIHSDTSPSALMAWPQLLQTKIHTDYVHGTYTAEFPGSVKAMAGKEITVAGYMVPLEAAAEAQHFILSRRTPTCPFCPPGEPNEVIDVEAQNPVAWTEERIVLSGTFELINNTQAGLFFTLRDAKEIKR